MRKQPTIVEAQRKKGCAGIKIVYHDGHVSAQMDVVCLQLEDCLGLHQLGRCVLTEHDQEPREHQSRSFLGLKPKYF